MTAIALNVLFFAALYIAAGWSTGPVERHVRQSFESGDLSREEWLRADPVRGNNQYNDCIVLHLILSPTKSRIEKVVAPISYTLDTSVSENCTPLSKIIADPSARERLNGSPYTRCWHGYVLSTGVLMRFFPLRPTRELLRGGIVMSLLMLAVLAWRRGGVVRTFGVTVALSGLLFWGLPYYGQGLSYAPGDIVLVLGVAAFLTARRLLKTERLVIAGTAYGCAIGFLEILTGQIPTAGGLLIVAVFVNCWQQNSSSADLGHSCWKAAAIALSAFGFGVIFTLIFKQSLTAMVLGVDAIRDFIEHLRLYLGITSSIDVYLQAFRSLIGSSKLLTYNSRGAAFLLLGISAICWIAGAYRAARIARSSSNPVVPRPRGRRVHDRSLDPDHAGARRTPPHMDVPDLTGADFARIQRVANSVGCGARVGARPHLSAIEPSMILDRFRQP